MAQFEMNGTELKKCRLDRGETEVVIPDGVTKLAGRLFKGRKTIVKVTLPESLTEIGEQAFMDCIALASCNLPDALKEIGGSVFEGCTALKSISLPSGSVYMPSKAFSGCTGLTEAAIPAGWDSVPHSIFQDCSNLRKVTIPEGVNTIKGNAFNGCANLQECSLPESVISIGGGVFTGTGVRSIRIPARVSEFWDSTFKNAGKLKKIEFAVFPQQGTKLYETLQKMLKEYPYLADAVAAADNVPQEFREYIDWIKDGARFPREKDLLWPQKLIKKLKYDDYIILFNSCRTIRMYVYHIIGNEYTECFEESVNCGSPEAQQLYYEWKDHFHWMMTNDCALRAYRYEHGELVEVREIDRSRYDSRVYVGCENELIMRKEFGMEPQSPEWKAKFAENLTKAEQFMQTLMYACYVNDTAAIIERAKTATKKELNSEFKDACNTPLMFCAKNDNPEGFKALLEAGADINQSIRGGYYCPIEDACFHSPSILLYIFENYPEDFDKFFGGWKHNLFYCKDRSMRELFFQKYGPQGLEDCYYTALLKPPAAMDSIQFLTAHHVDCSRYKNRTYKCTALEFAEKKCAEFPDNPNFKTALEMIRAEAERQLQEA